MIQSIIISITSVIATTVFCIADGARWDRIAIGLLVCVLPWCGAKARAFVTCFLPLWLAAIVVDGQRWYPLIGPVHTGDIRAADLALFHIGDQTIPEWLYAHPWTPLDLVCGAAYALFVWFYFALCIEMFVREPKRAPLVTWAFFVSNSLGAVIYVLVPAAPPWYVIEYGTGPANMNALSEAAGCARFDAFFGIHYFEAFYARNPNVFGAMPSLHVALPLIMTLATWHRGIAWRIATGSFTALVAFSAAYLAHHWVLDILAGALVGWFSYALVFTIRRRRHDLDYRHAGKELLAPV